MQNLILSFILLVIGCGSNQSESLAPCIVGTFGSNKPLMAFSSDDIKNSSITETEKQLVFGENGTGYYYVPVVKYHYPEYKVEFNYTVTETEIEITATKLFIAGREMPTDVITKNDHLLGQLRFYKLFSSLTQKISCNCSGSGIDYTLMKSATSSDYVTNGDPIFDDNKFENITTWMRRK